MRFMNSAHIVWMGPSAKRVGGEKKPTTCRAIPGLMAVALSLLLHILVRGGYVPEPPKKSGWCCVCVCVCMLDSIAAHIDGSQELL